MKAFMVKGVHNSGKTTLVAALVRGLRRRGYTVGTLKDIHFEGFHMDTPGTDTDLHRQAGASPAAALGPSETAFIFDRRLPVHRILRFFDQDFLILEGDPGLSCPNLVTGIAPEDWAFRKDAKTLGFSGILGGSTDEYQGLPVFDPEKDLDRIIALIEREGMDLDKNTQTERELKLYFDDEEVPMVPFVEKIIKASLMGILGELRGYNEDVKIKIEL